MTEVMRDVNDPLTGESVLKSARAKGVGGKPGTEFALGPLGAGSDYVALPGSVTFGPTDTSADVTVTPIDDTAIESSEGVTMTLVAGSGYNVGSPSAASGTITDNDTPVVSVVATDAAGAEQASDPIVFTLTRGGSSSTSITVNLVWSGTAVLTTDYTVNGSTNSAAKGSTVVLYVTGFGNTVCADAVASLCVPGATEVNLISGNVTPVGTVAVTIDGQAAAVQGAAAPIGSVPGLLQINVTVPTGVTAGKAVPVVVSISGAKSQSRVTMAVK